MNTFLAKAGTWGLLAMGGVAVALGTARADVITVVPQPPTTTATAPPYQTNRAPLQAVPFLKLPPGAISPRGWLLGQLQLDASGLTGRMKQISDYLNTSNNGWVIPGATGGWEEVAYWLRGYGDLGYVLNSSTIINDAVTNWIKPMMTTQVATGTNAGAFGPSPIYSGAPGSFDIWPLMPACEVLQHYYDYSGDPAVIPFLTNYFGWLNTHQSAIGPGWANNRWADHLETIYWLYNLTGQSFLLNLASNIHNVCGKQWLNGLPGLHNVNISQGFREPGEFWMQSGSASDLAAAETDYHRFMDPYGQYAGGGWGGDEFGRTGYRDPRQGFETCGHVELMKSLERLARISGNPVWADRCEQLAFNRLPTTMALDHSGVCYISAANAIRIDNVSKTHNQFANGTMKMMALMPGVHQYRCCTHNYTMGWPYYAEELWVATMDSGLCASLYAASQVRAKVADGSMITITEDTDYPFSDTITLTLASTNAQALSFPLYLRVPRWCATNQAVLKINGTPVAVSATPLAYIKIQRAWADGDIVTYQVPMQLGVTTWATNKNAVSLNYGPLDFALGIQENWSTLPVTDPNSREFNNTWPGYQVLPGSAWNYGLALDPANPTNGIQVTHNPGPLPANPFLPTNAPITLTVPARRIPAWMADPDNLVAQLQASPVRSTQALENVTLIPMGAAHLRISTFPTIGTGTNAHDWVATPLLWPTASASYVADDINALSDGIEAASSSDTSIPRFTWTGHKGTTEWVEYDYSQRIQVSSASVYWYDNGGTVRLPVSWQLLYKDPWGNWLPVPNPSAYGVQGNVYNTVAFSPVITRALRLQAVLPANAASGILEWRVSIDTLTVPTATVTSPVDGTIANPGAAVAFQATTASFTVPIARVDFYANGTFLGSSTNSPYQLTWNPPSTGIWPLWVVATGTNALAATSDPVSVTVIPTNMVFIAGGLYVDLRPGALANDGTTWTNWVGTGNFTSDGAHLPVYTTNLGVTAVQLDGSAGYKGPNTTAALLSGANPRSIEVWVNNPSLAGEETMVALGQRGANNNNFAFNFSTDTGWGALRMWGGDLAWNGAPTANAWHHLVATYDGATAKVYADGVLKNSLAKSLTTPVGPIWIGSQTADGVTPSVGWFSGCLGAVRIHTGVLSSNAVAVNYGLGPAVVVVPFTITASAGANGSISPVGVTSVLYGSSQTFAITPNLGYAVAQVTVDGVNQGPISSYTFTNVAANHTISATFVVGVTYTITATAGANGSISPSGSVVLNGGASKTFSITPNPGYAVSSVTVDGSSAGQVWSYTFTNVTANHTIAATFVAYTPPTPVAFYPFENNVNDTQGAYNGTAYGSPAYPTGNIGSSAIQFNGSSQYVSILRPVSNSFTVAFWVKTTQSSPTGANWYNGSGLVDGEVGGVTDDFGISYLNGKVAFGVGNPDTTLQSLSSINAGSWVHVACTRNSSSGQMKIYINGTLEATGTGPTGTKSAPATLHFGNLQTAINYFNGALDQLKFFNSVLSATDINYLVSEGISYTITASAGANGSISPNGPTSVRYGSSQTFTITPSPGCAVSQVTVDGVNQGALGSYTFSSVVGNHTIAAAFASLRPTLTLLANGSGGLDITWSDTYTNQLLWSPRLGSGATWTQVSGTPTHVGGLYKLTVIPGAAAAFYGLGH